MRLEIRASSETVGHIVLLRTNDIRHRLGVLFFYLWHRVNNQTMSQDSYINQIFFQDSRKMRDIPNNSVQLIVTSPPYFNVKDYSKDGRQEKSIGEKQNGQIGDISKYENYIKEMQKVCKECERVLKPNGKLVINTPLMPMLKKNLNTKQIWQMIF